MLLTRVVETALKWKSSSFSSSTTTTLNYRCQNVFYVFILVTFSTFLFYFFSNVLIIINVSKKCNEKQF